MALAGLLSAALFSQHAAAQGLFWGNSYEARQPQYAAYGGQAGYGAYAAPQYGAYGAQAHYGSPNQVYDEEYRPQVSPVPREVVASSGYSPGTIVISTAERRPLLRARRRHGDPLRHRRRPPRLHLGRHKTVARKAEWPDWTPPAADAEAPARPAAPHGRRHGNPLGARAMYLGGTLYRIHGSNEPETIGTAVSSGCIRMTNDDVIDLYDRVRVGTRVVVLR